jgi:hypothetical protein
VLGAHGDLDAHRAVYDGTEPGLFVAGSVNPLFGEHALQAPGGQQRSLKRLRLPGEPGRARTCR